MSSVTEIVESLESITQRMWNVNLDNDAFDVLKRKISCLSAQTVVHHALQEIATQLRGSQNAATLPHVQGRLGKFIDSLYGNSDKVDATKQRWQKLQELNCETFLFVDVFYTSLDISKMHRTKFSYLMKNAAQYVQAKDLSSRWMFRKEIQVTLATKTHLESIAQFRRSEFDSINLISQSSQRIRISWTQVQLRWFEGQTACKASSFRLVIVLNNMQD